MLVPATIVRRPGDNGSPPGGACKFTGSSHPDDGPYACTTAGYFSRSAVTDLARQMGLLIASEAQDRFEALLRALATAEQSCDSTVAAYAALESELVSERESRAASDALVAELEERLAAERTVADIADAWLKKTASKERR